MEYFQNDIPVTLTFLNKCGLKNLEVNNCDDLSEIDLKNACNVDGISLKSNTKLTNIPETVTSYSSCFLHKEDLSGLINLKKIEFISGYGHITNLGEFEVISKGDINNLIMPDIKKIEFETNAYNDVDLSSFTGIEELVTESNDLILPSGLKSYIYTNKLNHSIPPASLKSLEKMETSYIFDTPTFESPSEETEFVELPSGLKEVKLNVISYCADDNLPRDPVIITSDIPVFDIIAFDENINKKSAYLSVIRNLQQPGDKRTLDTVFMQQKLSMSGFVRIF